MPRESTGSKSRSDMIRIHTNSYYAAHGRMPRGTGLWFFYGPAEYSRHEPAKRPYFCYDGTYAEAKAAAAKWARKNNYSDIEAGS